MPRRVTDAERADARLRAAEANGGAAAARPIGAARYAVTGSSGTVYTIFAPDADLVRCDCKAGAHGAPCWHGAAVRLRLALDGPQRPATAPQSASSSDADADLARILDEIL